MSFKWPVVGSQKSEIIKDWNLRTLTTNSYGLSFHSGHNAMQVTQVGFLLFSPHFLLLLFHFQI